MRTLKGTADSIIAFNALLRLLLTWIPQGPEPKFVLHHPYFDIQNFIVADNGSLSAIIDWDGVCTEPRFIGNESYPMFLQRDSDPKGDLPDKDSNDEDSDDEDSDDEDSDDEDSDVEDSDDVDSNDEDCGDDTPEDLARYRTMYLEFMKDSKADAESDSDISTTKNSLLARSLATYATIPGYTNGVLRIIGELRELSTDDPRSPVSEYEENCISLGEVGEQNNYDYHLMLELGLAVAAGTLSQDRMAWLRDGFAKMWFS